MNWRTDLRVGKRRRSSERHCAHFGRHQICRARASTRLGEYHLRSGQNTPVSSSE